MSVCLGIMTWNDMTIETQFTGAIPALTTPFSTDESIDLVAWKQWTAWHNAQTSRAVVIFGSTGEGLSLSISERELLLKTARKQFDKTALIVGISSPSTEHAIQLGKQAKDHGADAILVTTPFYVKPTQSGLCQHYLKIASTVAMPIIVYTVPSRTAVDIDDQTILTLAQNRYIAGIKDAAGDIGRVERLRKLLPSNFMYLGGNDHEILDNIMYGGNGTISVIANVLPNIVQSVIDNFDANPQWSKGKMHELEPMINVITKYGNPQVIKHMVQSTYSVPSALRLPLTPLESEAKSETELALRACRIAPEAINY
jgi:4-hydroxy-tetrahydrodipicolinate synthase